MTWKVQPRPRVLDMIWVPMNILWTRPLSPFPPLTAKPGNHSVTLIWVTETEIDNAGFNIYRAGADGEFVKINAEMIPAQGTAASGATYQFVDNGRAEPSDLFLQAGRCGSERHSNPVRAENGDPTVYLFIQVRRQEPTERCFDVPARPLTDKENMPWSERMNMKPRR